MKYLLVILLAPLGLRAQDLPSIEDSISFYYGRLAAATSDSVRTTSSNAMRAHFTTAFTYNGVFDYPFDKLGFCHIISADHRVRLFNWNQPAENGSSHYYCYVLVWNEEKQRLSIDELTDREEEPDKLEQKYLAPEKWFGALYYEVIPMEKRRSNTYVLLGWESKDDLSTRKVIDALTVNNGNIRLGAPVFDMPESNRKRIIFEYSNEVSMSLRYYAKRKHIVWDHLSPRNPIMNGIFSDYGPDGSYDRLALVKGKWVFEENCDVSIYESDENRPYFDPAKRKRRHP